MEQYFELGFIILMMGGKSIKFSLLQTMIKKNFVFPGAVSSLTGIQFGDNNGQNYVTEENGVAMATTQVLF